MHAVDALVVDTVSTSGKVRVEGRVVDASPTHGAGVRLTRVIDGEVGGGAGGGPDLDPFLLLDEFGSSQAIAASYNGSEESVRRWRARARTSEVDRLVLEIAKRETKDYVFKVLNFYNAYRIIYPR